MTARVCVHLVNRIKQDRTMHSYKSTNDELERAPAHAQRVFFAGAVILAGLVQSSTYPAGAQDFGGLPGGYGMSMHTSFASPPDSSFQNLSGVARRAIGPRNGDARFVINNRVISYHNPHRIDWQKLRRNTTEILELARKQRDTEPIKYCELLEAMAAVQYRLQEYDEGIAMLKESLATRKEFTGSGNPELENTYQMLAVMYRGACNFPEAECMYTEAIRVAPGSDKLAIVNKARMHIDLACLYYDMGDVVKAQAMLTYVQRLTGANQITMHISRRLTPELVNDQCVGLNDAPTSEWPRIVEAAERFLISREEKLAERQAEKEALGAAPEPEAKNGK